MVELSCTETFEDHYGMEHHAEHENNFKESFRVHLLPEWDMEL
jgi:hypothetical protein